VTRWHQLACLDDPSIPEGGGEDYRIRPSARAKHFLRKVLTGYELHDDVWAVKLLKISILWNTMLCDFQITPRFNRVHRLRLQVKEYKQEINMKQIENGPM
jgi:hypothetical protein